MLAGDNLAGDRESGMEKADLARIHSWVVQRWHLDQFGHMNVRWYAHLFDDAIWMLWGAMGLDQNALQRAHGCHTVTAVSETTFRRECVDGDLIRVDGAVTRVGTRSVAFLLAARTPRTGEVHATCRVVEVFVSPGDHAPVPIPDALRGRLEALVGSPPPPPDAAAGG